MCHDMNGVCQLGGGGKPQHDTNISNLEEGSDWPNVARGKLPNFQLVSKNRDGELHMEGILTKPRESNLINIWEVTHMGVCNSKAPGSFWYNLQCLILDVTLSPVQLSRKVIFYVIFT